MPSMNTPRPFKVVIVGAGVSGLTLAHLLHKAGIDFVVIETRTAIGPPAGGSFGFWPNCARILDQIGCWDDIEGKGTPLEVNHIRRPDGLPFITSRMAAKIYAEYGYQFRVLERRTFVQLLYDNLVDQSKILTGKRVTDISQNSNNARVLFEDGACEGDIVVGCDGTHSTVRRIMWENANKSLPGLVSASEKRSLTSSYRCLVGVAPPIAGIGPNETDMIQNQGTYIFIVTQPRQTFFFVCIKEQKTSHWPQRSCFSEEDAEKEATKIADKPVSEHLLFGEIWSRRTRGYLCSLEEGVFKHWFFNRIVLLGDSAHKLSPVGAWAGTCAIESAAALANLLEEHVRLHPGTIRTNTGIQSIFEQYQKLREPRVQKLYGSVRLMTRLGSWDTYTLKFIALFVLPRMDDAAAVSSLIRGAVKVDFIPTPNRSKGFIDSRHQVDPMERRIQWPAERKAMTLYAIVGGFACTMLLVLRWWDVSGKATIRTV